MLGEGVDLGFSHPEKLCHAIRISGPTSTRQSGLGCLELAPSGTLAGKWLSSSFWGRAGPVRGHVSSV